MATYDLLRFTATSGDTDFLITFSYNTNKPASVEVVKDGVAQVSGVDYTLVDNFTVRFATAMIGGEKIVVRRVTDRATRGIPAWNNTSPLSKASHNTQDDEMYRFAQELDVEKGMPRSDTTFQYTAQDENGDPLRVEDMDDPLSATDGVNLQYLESRLGGGTIGLAGYYRGDFLGDGITTTYEILPSGSGQLTATSKVLVWATGSTTPIDPGDYSLDSTKRKIIFNNPPPNAVRYDWFVLTAAVTSIADGEILPAKIALTQDSLITGDAGGLGSEITRASLLLSEFGAPTSDISMGNNKLTDLVNPTDNQGAATKIYVDAGLAGIEAFPTVTNNIALVRDTYVQHAGTETALILATLKEDTSVGQETVFEARIADDGIGTGAVLTGGQVRFYSSGGRDYFQLSFLVPAGKYFAIFATSGSDASKNKISITYQKGS